MRCEASEHPALGEMKEINNELVKMERLLVKTPNKGVVGGFMNVEHQQGRRKITGESLNFKYFSDYLHKKYELIFEV